MADLSHAVQSEETSCSPPQGLKLTRHTPCACAVAVCAIRRGESSGTGLTR